MTNEIWTDKDRILAAGELAGADSAALTGVRAAVARRDTLRGLARERDEDLNREYVRRLPATKAEDLPALAREAAARYAVLAGARTLWGHGERTVTAAITGELNAAIPALYEQVLPALTRAVTGINKAASDLPKGDEALDSDTVLLANAGPAYLQVTECVDLLTLWGKVFPVVRPGERTHTGLWVTRLVDVPACEVRLTHGHYRHPLNTSEQHEIRDAVQRLAQDASITPALTLVNVARGEYLGCKLAPAPSLGEASERLLRANPAFTTRLANEQETRLYNQRVAREERRLHPRPPVVAVPSGPA